MKPIAVLDNILVERVVDQNKAGLVLPEYVKNDERAEGKGRVISVGQGIRRADGTIAPQIIKEGDIIYFSRYTPVKIEDKEYLITKEVHVLLILKDEKVKSNKHK
jgi:co-chaperonin GroES (HSP10)